jgi:hypothetical protein
MKHKTLNADKQINGSSITDFSADEGSCVLLCALNLIPSGRITSEFPYLRGFRIKFENFFMGGGSGSHMGVIFMKNISTDRKNLLLLSLEEDAGMGSVPQLRNPGVIF